MKNLILMALFSLMYIGCKNEVAVEETDISTVEEVVVDTTVAKIDTISHE